MGLEVKTASVRRDAIAEAADAAFLRAGANNLNARWGVVAYEKELVPARPLCDTLGN